MSKTKAYEWFMESSVAPKKQRIFIRKQMCEIQKQYEFWDYLDLIYRKFQKKRCYYCGEKIVGHPLKVYAKEERRDWEIDHKLAIYYGGTNAPRNLCLACKACNREKGVDLMERNLKAINLTNTGKRINKQKKIYF